MSRICTLRLTIFRKSTSNNKMMTKVNESKYDRSEEAGERSKTQPSVKQSSSGNSGAFALLSPVGEYDDDYTQSINWKND